MYTRETGSLTLSETKLELTLQKDEVAEGTVEISARNDQEFVGYVYSSDYRMQCRRKKISGTRVMLSYQFDSSGMEYGDVMKGEICIVTGFGQYYLPFQAEVQKMTIQSSMGPVKNLFHFVNLAKTHWKEAVAVYYSDIFADILVGADRQYLAAYIGLSKYKYNEQNMDEFLISTNKKQRQTFRLTQEPASFDALSQDRRGEVVIEKDGWGYTYLRISILGDFIRVDKQVLTDEDFVGNRCNISYEILDEKLHDGQNYGRILVKNREENLAFDVTVTEGRRDKKESSCNKAERSLTLYMTQNYLNRRMDRMDREEWLSGCEEQVNQVTKQHTGSLLARLYQIHLLLIRERANEAKWILNRVADMLEQGQGDDAEYAYYLFLTSLYEKNAEAAHFTAKELHKLDKANPRDFRFLWLLLNLDEELKADSIRIYQELEAKFKRGARSPVMYLEAYRILESEPKQFCRIGSFEIEILRFAVKYHMLSEEMFRQIAYLSSKTRERERELLPILEYGYQVFGGEVILQAICSLLIQNACTDHKYFVYFQKAVEQGLRLTRMYEYYMLTMDPGSKRRLPKAVLMFFSYECHLDYARKAYVLVSACRQKEEIESVFDSFEKQIPDFIKEQIRNNRISEDLAYLYDHYLGSIEFDEDLAEHFVKMVFKHRIETGRDDIRNVVVVHPQLKEERVYPVTGREAHASVYTDGYCILLEDFENNRYVPKEKLQLDPLLLYKKLAYLLENFKLDHLGFWLYLCDDKKAYAMIDVENATAFTNLLLSPKVADYYKQQFCKRLLRYYFENDYMAELESVIGKLNFSNVAVQDRDDVVRYMVILRQYDMAYEFIMNYGFEHIAPKTLARICVHQLENTKGLSMRMLWLCYEVFKKGKAKSEILSYLAEYFDGTARQMKDVWMAAKEHNIDTVKLERRILSQLLFGDGYLAQKAEIFDSYVRHTKGVDDLMRAYVARCSYDFFVRDYITGEKLFDEILRFIHRKEPLVLVCKLALLKHFAGVKSSNGVISPEEKQMIIECLGELIDQKFFFSFFVEFKDWVPLLLPGMECSYVEYRSQPGCKVTIHYVIAEEGKSDSSYVKEPMREVYDGYYLKSFCLFFSQQLQYYITIEEDGAQSLVESGEMEKLDVTDMLKETRFSLLNDILVSNALQDQNTTRQLIYEYGEKVWMAEELLKLR